MKKINLRNTFMISFARRAFLVAAMLLLAGVTHSAEFKTITYYHVDDLGTPIAATNEGGDALWRNFNSPYGVRYTKAGLQSAIGPEGPDVTSTGESTAILNRIGYTGHVEDKIGGRQLIYMQARFYDPAIGRFLSIDPVRYTERNPMSYNRYAYANSNPLGFVDPNGESPLEVFTEILPSAGRSFGGLAALGVGFVTGDQALMNAAMNGMAAQQSENLFALASLVAPPGANKARKAINYRKQVCSFEGSTEVLTDEGYLPIRDLNDADTIVLAKDEKTGEQRWKPVLDHYWNHYEKTVYISIEDIETGASQTLVSNTVHPFFAVRETHRSLASLKVAFKPKATTPEPTVYSGSIPNGAWIQAAELQLGDRLLNADESWSVVTGVRIASKGLRAFNLNVADFDSFYVRGSDSNSSVGVWVHNCNKNVANRVTPTTKQLDKFQDQLQEHGQKSVERSQRKIERRIREHRENLEKYKEAGGHTSSVEREIRNFERELEAIKQTLGEGS
ncbi:MAG: polymorphic toxin-type HINT domain-containing protein [Granulosicoccaceae bacterium]